MALGGARTLGYLELLSNVREVLSGDTPSAGVIYALENTPSTLVLRHPEYVYGLN